MKFRNLKDRSPYPLRFVMNSGVRAIKAGASDVKHVAPRRAEPIDWVKRLNAQRCNKGAMEREIEVRNSTLLNDSVEARDCSSKGMVSTLSSISGGHNVRVVSSPGGTARSFAEPMALA